MPVINNPPKPEQYAASPLWPAVVAAKAAWVAARTAGASDTRAKQRAYIAKMRECAISLGFPWDEV